MKAKIKRLAPGSVIGVFGGFPISVTLDKTTYYLGLNRVGTGIGNGGNCGLSYSGSLHLVQIFPKADSWGNYISHTPPRELLDALITDPEIITELMCHEFSYKLHAAVLFNDSLNNVTNYKNPFQWGTANFMKFLIKHEVGIVAPGPLYQNPNYANQDHHLIQCWYWTPPDREHLVIRAPEVKKLKSIKAPVEYANTFRSKYGDKVEKVTKNVADFYGDMGDVVGLDK